MTWIIALKTVKGKWASMKTMPGKYVQTFYNIKEALDMIEKSNLLIEMWTKEKPTMKVLKIKYTRETIRDQDILEEYDSEIEKNRMKKIMEKKREDEK